ncbi:MAG TPA: hypothetical protein VFJ19_17745 [Nocardioidaceae bacterium]|nr:hypothetical protein [Nocardioidaceae bacterium]
MRRQVLALGLDDEHLRRAVRRRELTRVCDGVLVNHTGALTWLQRAWAAVLFCWPAALSHDFVLRAHDLGSRGGGGRDPAQSPPVAVVEPIHVAIDHARTVMAPPGVRVHRKRGWAALVHPVRQPPQLRLEEAVLDVAAHAPDDAGAIATLADACQSHRTTADRLAEALRARQRLPRRKLLLAVLDDVATGTYSLLEHRYLTRVERPHGLPTGKRQRRVRIGRTSAYRDVEYVRLRQVVELDGRLGHELQSDRWDDFDRDLASAEEGTATTRVGWRHVLDSCRLAAAVASC